MTDVATRDAKHPVSIVAGPYGHPFHPMVVTVPIGAWTASLVFDLVSRWSSRPDVFATGSRWLLGIGILGALVAAVLGFLDYLTIPADTPARRTATTHMVLNLAVTAALTLSFLLRDGVGPVSWGLIVWSAVALAALGLSGWLGGKLTYHYGVRVADEATQRQGIGRR